MSTPKSNWKGLAAALNEGDSDTADEPVTTAPVTTVAEAAATKPDAAPTEPAQSVTSALAAAKAAHPVRRPRTTDAAGAKRQRALPGQTRFVDNNRMVGIYFPFAVDEAMREAAAAEGMSNSAFVVAAVEDRLRNRK